MNYVIGMIIKNSKISKIDKLTIDSKSSMYLLLRIYTKKSDLQLAMIFFDISW